MGEGPESQALHCCDLVHTCNVPTNVQLFNHKSLAALKSRWEVFLKGVLYFYHIGIIQCNVNALLYYTGDQIN